MIIVGHNVSVCVAAKSTRAGRQHGSTHELITVNGKQRQLPANSINLLQDAGYRYAALLLALISVD